MDIPKDTGCAHGFPGTIAVCLLLIGVQAAVSAAIEAVARRDIGWVPGPWAAVQDFAFDWSWTIGLLVLLLAEIPALWWRRLGGGTHGVSGLAFICPFAVFGRKLIPKGYPEDMLVLIGGTIFILVVAIAASTLTILFTRPIAGSES